MARVFAYLMSNDLKEITDEGIFNDTSNIIKQALENIYKQNKTKKNIAKTALEIALKQLVERKKEKHGNIYCCSIYFRLFSNNTRTQLKN
jgi:peroxiredoxin family protein